MYDPEQYWDAKARNAADAAAAVRVGDPALDRCIERTQSELILRAIRRMQNAYFGQPVASSSAVESSAAAKSGAVLDFGCGTGQWTELLQKHFGRYAGTDISGGMLDTARETHPGSDFHLLKNSKLPFDDDEFDAAFSIAVLHHNNYPQQELLLAEIRRVVRSDGWLVLFEGIGQATTDSSSHFYYRTPSAWQDVLAEYRFKCVWANNCRYGLFWYLVERIEDRLVRKRHASNQQREQSVSNWRETLRRSVLGFDYHMDHRLLDWIPDRIAGRRMMLLQSY